MRDPQAGQQVEVPPVVPYDGELKERVHRHLSGHVRREVPLDDRRRAAVAVVLVDSEVGEDRIDPAPWDIRAMDQIPGGAQGLDGRMENVSGGAAFLLCRRSSRLRAHAAQWALPGGRLDEGEDAVDAALRETHEELGVPLPRSEVLGLLDDYPTRSGYVITPVVIWGGGRLDLAPSPDEVLAAYRIGLHNLLRPDSPRYIDIPESDRPVIQLPLGNDLIHAPTGAVLFQFRLLGLDGDPSPVDHLEQPTFAWR
ncbi:NUDIX hydrolase [Nocardioides daejeonensis]|uniref:NUDIX hydrolase n=1 Tax=Nocardioides daejeonensis TaxID=1046556 RepID=UPI001EF4809C|nr:CoA pyrophosphatase [Nocardioides daejeonensis]